MMLRSIRNSLLLGLFGAIATLAGPSVGRASSMVAPGWDLFETIPGTGSPPNQTGTKFQGTNLKGVPLGSFNFPGIGVRPTGDIDTIVQRLDPAVPGVNNTNFTQPPLPANTGRVDLQLVALQLMSVGSVPPFTETLQSQRGLNPTDPLPRPVSAGFMDITFFGQEPPLPTPGNPQPVHGSFRSFLDVFFDIRTGGSDGPIVSSGEIGLVGFGSWSHFPPPEAPPHPPLIDNVNFTLAPDNSQLQDFFVVRTTDPNGFRLDIMEMKIVDPPFPSNPFMALVDPTTMHVVGLIPEPSSFVLLGIGVLGIFGYSWRRRKPVA